MTQRDRVTEGAVGGRGRPIGIVCAAIARLLAQGYPLLSSPSTRPSLALARPRLPGSPAIFAGSPFLVRSRRSASPGHDGPLTNAVDSRTRISELRGGCVCFVLPEHSLSVFRTRLYPRANVSPPICLPFAPPPPACPPVHPCRGPVVHTALPPHNASVPAVSTPSQCGEAVGGMVGAPMPHVGLGDASLALLHAHTLSHR